MTIDHYTDRKILDPSFYQTFKDAICQSYTRSFREDKKRKHQLVFGDQSSLHTHTLQANNEKGNLKTTSRIHNVSMLMQKIMHDDQTGFIS